MSRLSKPNGKLAALESGIEASPERIPHWGVTGWRFAPLVLALKSASPRPHEGRTCKVAMGPTRVLQLRHAYSDD